jgi:hypothetical protein
MKTLEMFNDFLAESLAETPDASADDIGTMMALAFLESAGDHEAALDALERLAKAYNNRPLVQDSLAVVRGAIDQMKVGEWVSD